MKPVQRRPALLVWLSGPLLPGVLFFASPAVAAGDMDATQTAICAKLAPGGNAPLEGEDRTAAAAFYQARECRPVWVDEHGPTRAATRAIAELKHAADWGLTAADFKLTAVDQPMTLGQWSNDQTADAELEITSETLRYAQQAQGGRIPEPEKLLSAYIGRQPQLSSAADILAQLTQSDDPGAVLRSYQPPQDQFLKLKALLADLRGKQQIPSDDVQIPLRGPMLQLGSENPDVAILKKRFGIASTVGAEQIFDAPLAEAIKKFQSSVSLSSDGIIGPATRVALAGGGQDSVADKIAAVLANMEEWRWMPRSLGATHVLVNIPSFSVTLTNDGRTVFDERVIVGTPSTQTPIFSKDMTTIVLRPKWYLPDSIKLTSLLSGRSLERQGYVITRNGRVVSSAEIDWSRAKLDQYEVYQPAGDDNALGLVKLLFPNKYSVYLHDTPQKYLFNNSVRLFSHGCMRVRNPQELAQSIFDIDRGSGAPDVKRLVRKGPMSNRIMLETPIPVHVAYFTVWVGADGQPNYYPDYYGHQRRITLALAGKWNEIDVGRDRLADLDTSALKNLKLGDGPAKADDDADSSASDVSKVRYGDGVGDIIRRQLGF